MQILLYTKLHNQDIADEKRGELVARNALVKMSGPLVSHRYIPETGLTPTYLVLMLSNKSFGLKCLQENTLFENHEKSLILN